MWVLGLIGTIAGSLIVAVLRMFLVFKGGELPCSDYF